MYWHRVVGRRTHQGAGKEIDALVYVHAENWLDAIKKYDTIGHGLKPSLFSDRNNTNHSGVKGSFLPDVEPASRREVIVRNLEHLAEIDQWYLIVKKGL